jgi:hypothetical protein
VIHGESTDPNQSLNTASQHHTARKNQVEVKIPTMVLLKRHEPMPCNPADNPKKLQEREKETRPMSPRKKKQKRSCSLL